MITSLRLIDFKNFADATLHLGPFTVLVGANASGKSNIRDAFRFLHGVGRGYRLAEILGGKFGTGGQLEWEPIRGAPLEIIRFGSLYTRMDMTLRLGGKAADFSIIFSKDLVENDRFKTVKEHLAVDEDIIFNRYDEDCHMPNRGSKYLKHIKTDQPALTQLIRRFVIEDDLSYIRQVISAFSSIKFLDPLISQLRLPSFPGQVILGKSGENLPGALREICLNDAHKAALVHWIHELAPMDIVDFEFPVDLDGKIHLILVEKNGTKVSAYAASDGTLRFLAMLATLLGKGDGLYFFEEIDNGIHPSRLQLLVDLIETQTAKGHLQVVATTHSPELLSIVNDETFQNTSVVCRREGTANAVIRPVLKIPNAIELRKSQGLGRLLAGGWMETALAFTEDDEDGEEAPG